MDIQNLIERFADAGIDLERAAEPIARGANAEDIFQMDIRRKRPRDAHSEYFVAWPGHAENLVVVQGVDRSELQLVLMVREPRRAFWERVPATAMRFAQKRRGAAWREAIAEQARVEVDDIVVSHGDAFVRRSTPDRKRHFLAGRDERQLFMCQLPRACTTVRQAHEVLRAPAATESRSAIERPIRQGEWFFLSLETVERDELERLLAGGRVILRRKASIGAFIPRAGKPHVADELVAIPRDGTLHVYVRGAVRHVDHKTIWIEPWRRVVRNREVDEGRSPFGGTWID